MKILFFIFLSIISLSKTFSQAILLEDDFTDNKNNWFTGTDHTTYKVSLQNGNYILDRHGDISNTLIYKHLTINPQKDFSIEATMTQESGAVHNGYGLIWYSKPGNY